MTEQPTGFEIMDTPEKKKAHLEYLESIRQSTELDPEPRYDAIYEQGLKNMNSGGELPLGQSTNLDKAIDKHMCLHCTAKLTCQETHKTCFDIQQLLAAFEAHYFEPEAIERVARMLHDRDHNPNYPTWDLLGCYSKQAYLADAKAIIGAPEEVL